VRQIRNVAKHENMNTTNIENLKALPIADYLHHIGINVPQRGNICATWRGDSNPSVSINTTKNVWYDHGTGEGGSVSTQVPRARLSSHGVTNPTAFAADFLLSDYIIVKYPGCSSCDEQP
jgi:hypothetical protein